MTPLGGLAVQRWTGASKAAVPVLAIAIALLAAGPFLFSAEAIDRLTTLFIYVILAAMWNALAGYGGLVSVGQQAFFGLGAYAAIRLSDFGVGVGPALLIGAVLAGVSAIPLAVVMPRLTLGEFAVGMWVVAAACHLLVDLDPLVNGETGTSLIALNAYAPAVRRADIYWLALAATIGLLAMIFVLLRSRLGAAIQAIRDDEVGAASIGIRVLASKRLIFILAGFGCAVAGMLWIASSITFQPRTYFGIQWTAYMVFMALVGGIGTFEGPLIGAVIFFAIETWFGESGVWYMVVLAAVAILFALFLPRGLWGTVEDRFGLRLLPVGYFVRRRGPAAHQRLNEPEGVPNEAAGAGRGD
jgi:branched-chain amino acid transport system permease protein